MARQSRVELWVAVGFGRAVLERALVGGGQEVGTVEQGLGALGQERRCGGRVGELGGERDWCGGGCCDGGCHI